VLSFIPAGDDGKMIGFYCIRFEGEMGWHMRKFGDKRSAALCGKDSRLDDSGDVEGTPLDCQTCKEQFILEWMAI